MADYPLRFPGINGRSKGRLKPLVPRLDLAPEKDGTIWLDIVADLHSLGVNLSIENVRELHEWLGSHLASHGAPTGHA